MQKITGDEGSMWGTSIVGFGKSKYKLANGKENEWMAVGFSPRKQNLAIYIMTGFNRYKELLKKLGKHKTGKSCLYLKRLEDIDMKILEDIIRLSVNEIEEDNS